MNHRFGRRAFLGITPLAVSAAMHTFAALDPRANVTKLLAPASAGNADVGGYGPLNPKAARNTGETLLALPEGFEYNVLGKAGAKMSDGHPTPMAHDGMAAFNVNGQWRLVRNHEVNNGIGKEGAAFGNAAQAYDAKAGGGTTTLIIDPKTREVVRDFVSLNGTLNNCAGGPTPWGSWISCEETVLGPALVKDAQGRERGNFARPHGYCFEVSARADGAAQAIPLKSLGRFVHEAIAVDAKTGIVYLTEDRGAAGLYRFLPKRKGKLAEGGQLQMLAVAGKSQFDLRTGQKNGQSYAVTWVNINDPDPANADATSIYDQGFALGAATFARLEGIWYGGDSLFFTATSGGDNRLGQVWQYLPQGQDKGTLKLIFESPGEAVLDMPDNLCVSPRGALVLCEDGHNEQFLRGLTRQGQIFDLARNVMTENSELAGATFSPDGKTLFFNLQRPGITIALWGPWERGGL
ncbi:MAG TPA: alkaline phosphatase PhoX [Blastocatellia bacterium]